MSGIERRWQMSTTTSATSRFDMLSPDQELSRIMNNVFARYIKSVNIEVHTRLLHHWREINSQAKRDLFIVAFRGNFLDEINLREARHRKTAGMKRFLLFPDDSPQEALPEKICRLGIRSPERIHTPRLEVDTMETFLRRFFAALSHSPQEDSIADAWWEGDVFVILSPMFTRLKVPLDSIPKMNSASPDELAEFEIDEFGEYIYWPSHDVHMGWPQFEQIINPTLAFTAKQHSSDFNRHYGEAIRALREETGLRQSDIMGLDPRTIRRIEQGEVRATSNALQKLAVAHGMHINSYLNSLAENLKKGLGKNYA